MKKSFLFLFFIIYSVISLCQLDSVIRDIIDYKSAFISIYEEETAMDIDSMQKFHQQTISTYTTQKQLEYILDTTNSIDLKYYCAVALVNHPSLKISDVFLDILKDSNAYQENDIENSCLTYSSSVKGVPWYSACYLLKDSSLSAEHLEVLKREIFQMDSLTVTNLRFDEEGNEIGDYYKIYEDVSERHWKIRDPKLTKIYLLTYFNNIITKSLAKVYGKDSSCLKGELQLRMEIESNFHYMDSVSILLNYENEIYYYNLWLNSKYKVIQVYGAEGLIRLNNMGAKLSRDQIDKINKLKLSSQKIKICSDKKIRHETIRKILSPFSLN